MVIDKENVGNFKYIAVDSDDVEEFNKVLVDLEKAGFEMMPNSFQTHLIQGIISTTTYHCLMVKISRS